MAVEDAGDLRDVADGKADAHGALRFKWIREPCLSDFPARVETVFGGAGSDVGDAAGKFELPPSVPIGRATVLSKPRNQGLVPRRTFARKIPLFFNALNPE
jgi:hypothetical protein